MSEPFIAEVRIFAGNFAPRGWAFCDGQLLPISNNTALFSLVGTTYGGDGRSTMALPNLQGRAPMGPRRGPGLTTRRLGEKGGVQQVTLSETQMPSHAHALHAGDEEVDSAAANSSVLPGADVELYSNSTTSVEMSSNSITPAGSSLPHFNIQPVVTLNYIIALLGLYPSRS